MPETRSADGWLRWLAVVLTLAALYLVTARLGLMLALPPENKATMVWPPSGIALAAFLLYGHRIWPGVWLGSFLANLWDGFNAASPSPLSAHLFVSMGIAPPVPPSKPWRGTFSSGAGLARFIPSSKPPTPSRSQAWRCSCA